MTAHELAEFDRIKNDVYDILKNSGEGVLLLNFEAANEACTKIAEYITGKQEKYLTLADGTKVVYSENES